MVLQGESWSHLWYLYLILFLYLVTPLLKYLLMKMPLWSVYAVLGGLLLGGSIMPFVKKLFSLEELWTLPDGSIYLFYYMCGYLFVRLRERMNVSRGCAGLLAAGIVLLAAGMVISRVSGSYLLQMAYNYPFTVVLALLLFGLGVCGEPGTGQRKPGTAIWQKAGAVCFAVYLVHPVFLNVYYKFFHISPLDFCIWVSLPIFFLATLIPAMLAAWILCKIPVLKKWVL